MWIRVYVYGRCCVCVSLISPQFEECENFINKQTKALIPFDKMYIFYLCLITINSLYFSFVEKNVNNSQLKISI